MNVSDGVILGTTILKKKDLQRIKKSDKKFVKKLDCNYIEFQVTQNQYNKIEKQNIL